MVRCAPTGAGLEVFALLTGLRPSEFFGVEYDALSLDQSGGAERGVDVLPVMQRQAATRLEERLLRTQLAPSDEGRPM